MARILVAEDDQSVQSFVTHALNNAGHAVTPVGDGLLALEALGAPGGTDYDLLITDIVMPGMDGIALALRVARDQPGLPILLITGYAAEQQRAHNLDEIIFDVVQKPFTLAQICHQAEEALA